MNKISIFVQARMGSTRLPQKIVLPLGGKEVLSHLIDRLAYVTKANHQAILIPKSLKNNELAHFLQTHHPKIARFRGAEFDVLSRYYRAAKQFKSDVIVRLTSDCPLLDPAIIDATIELFLKTPGCQYASNSLHRTFPRGMDVEVFSFEALEKTFLQAKAQDEREHVTLYIYRHPELFKLASLVSSIDLSSLRLTLDEPQDLLTLREVYERLTPSKEVSSLQDIYNLYKERPELFSLNSRVQQKPVHIEHAIKEALDKTLSEVYPVT